ncbi:MAG: DUF3465 domain-containing protein [Gemmatimonas sp.]
MRRVRFLTLAALLVATAGCDPVASREAAQRGETPRESPSTRRKTPRPAARATTPTSSGDAVLRRAFEQRGRNVEVEGRGTVTRILSDDREGSRHQRFVLKLASGQMVLITHNIDIAPRIAALRTGDEVEFRGEYEWTARGGVVHWTHSDPDGRHRGGWLRHHGRTYR